jgi:hypothetical protein
VQSLWLRLGHHRRLRQRLQRDSAPRIGSSCEACNSCGDCSWGFTDACGAGCDAIAPPEEGPQPCEACNSCGDCDWGSSDYCGNGCSAIAPDESLCD